MIVLKWLAEPIEVSDDGLECFASEMIFAGVMGNK